MSTAEEQIDEKQQLQWYCELLRRALDQTNDIGEATEAAELALSLQPWPEGKFGMVGDEWHGPTAPGPGWVEVGKGPKGGKRWRKQGGAGRPAGTPQRSPPTTSILKQMAAGDHQGAIKTYRSLTPEWRAKVATELPDEAKKSLNEVSKKQQASASSAPLKEEEIGGFLKRNGLDGWYNSLPEVDYKAAEGYKSWGFGINDALRSPYVYGEKPELEEDQVDYINQLDSMIDKAPPLKEPVTVSRIMKFNKYKMNEYNDFANKASNGNTFSDPGFVSTTLSSQFIDNVRNAKSGSDDILVEIELRLPVGTKAAYITENETLTGHEKEMLLPRGGNYKVIESILSGKRGKVVVEYQGATPTPSQSLLRRDQ